jgi:hypothetical protein
VLRDVVGAPAEEVRAERARVAREGWGGRLLELQGTDGQWAGGTYFPAGFASADDDSQPWTATAHTLRLLVHFGVDPADERVRAAVAAVRDNCRWEHDGQAFFDGEVEPCINGMTVVIGSYFGEDVDRIVARLADDQLADGGWNCWTEFGSTVSSFASTLSVLEGLLAHERATGQDHGDLRRRGEEYLLERHLFRRRSTGEVADPHFLEFSFPPRWHYDVLRALEYFGRNDDPRLTEAREIVRRKRQPDGTWLLENTHPGDVHFALEDGDGKPSRWNTLRALRLA